MGTGLLSSSSLGSGYRYNLKYELAEYFIKKAFDEGVNAGISMNMFVYDCPSSIPPDTVADGGIYCCTTDDEKEAAAIIPRFYTKIGEEAPSYKSGGFYHSYENWHTCYS